TTASRARASNARACRPGGGRADSGAMTSPVRAPVRGRLTALRGANALNLMLVFVPLAALGEWLHWSGAVVFTCAALAIVPCAGMMGHATERLAARLGAGVGGLLNATFGNAAE